ncbi:MAG: hypothetical protein IMY67_07860, partial [Bacteroidetes bacterium]|nr:hypothetical protein [Bacteroidota bacterium]
IFTINHITDDGFDDGPIAWPSENSNGIYFKSLSLVNCLKKENRIKLKFIK